MDFKNKTRKILPLVRLISALIPPPSLSLLLRCVSEIQAERGTFACFIKGAGEEGMERKSRAVTIPFGGGESWGRAGGRAGGGGGQRGPGPGRRVLADGLAAERTQLGSGRWPCLAESGSAGC